MEEIRNTNIFAMMVCLAVLWIAGTSTLQAQFVDEPEFYVVTREDGPVYVYHSTRLPLGFSYNIYRRGADEGEEENHLLNEEPLEIASSEAELRSRLGTVYWELRTTLTTASDNREILYALRSDHSTGMMATFLYEEAAKALGRLWIDDEAEHHQTVIYTLEVLDEFKDPVGEVFTHHAELVPSRPPAPAGLTGNHEGRYVTLQWDYPAEDSVPDRNVLYFNIHQLLEDGARRKMNPEIIIRNREEASFEYEFAVQTIGREYTFVVEAVDISGQPGYASEAFTIEVTDNMPPGFLTDVQGFADEDGHAVITWPMAIEAGTAGYYLYRAETSEEDADLQRLNTVPLPVDQVSYTDSLAGRSGDSELWFYRVTVVSAAGLESLTSNAAMVHLPVMEAPPPATVFNAEVLDDGGVLFTWEAPEMPERFTGWVILERDLSRRASDAAVQITQDSLFAHQYTYYGTTESGLNEGTTYEYALASQDGDRFTSEFLHVTVTIPKTTPPDAPGNLRAFNEDGFRVRLNWNPSPDLFLESYRVYRALPGGAPESLMELPAPGLSWRDESVEAGETYIYTITATDSFGNVSLHSEPDTVFVRTFTIPRTVRNIRAEELDEGGVRIWWEPVPDSNLAGYRVFRSAIPTGVFEELHPGLIEGTVFTDPEGKRGMWYRVQAYDTSTNESRAGEAAQAR